MGESVQYIAHTIDNLIFTGRRRLVEGGLACWCAVGRHWFIYPLPRELDETWWRRYADAFCEDSENCEELRSQGLIELKQPWD